MPRTRWTTQYAPPGWHTLTPRLFAKDPQALHAFLKKVFKIAGRYSAERPTVVTLGDSKLMISGIEVRKPAAGVFYVYVKNADATYRSAVAAGAKTVEEPCDMHYGDRRCIVKDRWGNTWQIATYRGQ